MRINPLGKMWSENLRITPSSERHHFLFACITVIFVLFQLIERHPCWIQFWMNIMGTQLHDLNESEKYVLMKRSRSRKPEL